MEDQLAELRNADRDLFPGSYTIRALRDSRYHKHCLRNCRTHRQLDRSECSINRVALHGKSETCEVS